MWAAITRCQRLERIQETLGLLSVVVIATAVYGSLAVIALAVVLSVPGSGR